MKTRRLVSIPEKLLGNETTSLKCRHQDINHIQASISETEDLQLIDLSYNKLEHILWNYGSYHG